MRRTSVVLLVVLVSAAVLAPSHAANPPVFGGGIYYIEPPLDSPGGTVNKLDGADPDVEMTGQGFDLSPRKLVWTEDGRVVITYPTGETEDVEVEGLYAIARPSLSPNGRQIAVQATETPFSNETGPEFLTIYVISLATGDWRRLGPIPEQAVPGYEIPEWLPTGNRIAYWAIEDDCQTVRIVDATTGETETTIRDDGPTGCFNPNGSTGPRFHIATSENGKRLLIPGQMQVYDVDTGELVTDLRAEALAGIEAAGYEPDDRYPGQGNAGVFPLDGAFSPDGTELIFDGAVHRLSDDTFGLLLMTINLDGSGFSVLEGPIANDPMWSNNNNFSLLTPLWLPSYQPDAQVKVGASYAGNNVYNLTGKSQTASAKAAPGRSKTFYVRIQNDGDAKDSLRIVGAGGIRGFTVKYVAGTKVITSKVLNGTYSVTLAPGATKVIKFVVTIKSTTASRTTATWPIRATSSTAGLKDVVKARLTAN
jgi:hypothetical protein